MGTFPSSSALHLLASLLIPANLFKANQQTNMSHGHGKAAEGPATEYLYKILVVGDIGTGKTAIIRRCVENQFSESYKTTIGVDFALKTIQRSNATIHLQLWDIAGQERYGNLTRVYYKEAVGAFVVFDLTRNSSFEAVKRWKEDIDNKVRLPNGDPLPVVLLANKCDLVKTPLSEEVMNDYCKENGFLAWFATSAKENINIDEAVNFLVENIIVHGSNDAIKGPGPDALKVGGERGGAPDSNACGC